MKIEEAQVFHARDFQMVLDIVAKEKIYLALTEAPPEDKIQSFIQHNLQIGNPHFFAFDGEKMIGWIDIKKYSHISTSHRAELGMGVLDDYRGKGVGKALLEAAMSKASRVGIEKVELEVFTDNEAAIKLYEKSGFQKEGLITKFRKLEDGSYQNVLVMGQFLN